MAIRLVQLEKIEQAGPFKNYRNWLLWKLNHLVAGDVLQLPIFSAWTIKRESKGFIAINRAAETVYAFSISLANFGERLIEAIETQVWSAQHHIEKFLVNLGSAEILLAKGVSQAKTRKKLRCRASIVLLAAVA